MKRRWPVALLALVLALVGGSLIVALLSERRIRGAIPAPGPAIAFAAIDAGRLVATTRGLYVSRDDVDWAFAPQFGSKALLVASGGGLSAIRHSNERRRTLITRDLDDFDEIVDDAPLGSAMAIDPGGQIHVIDGAAQTLYQVSGSGVVRMTLPEGGPGGANALSVPSLGQERVLVGNMASGLWELTFNEKRWLRLVATPTRSVLIDERDEERIFLGTPGGLLVSHNSGRSWTFTSLRERIDGLAQDTGRYYAVTERKVVFRSIDGEKNWIAPSTNP